MLFPCILSSYQYPETSIQHLSLATKVIKKLDINFKILAYIDRLEGI